MKMPEWLKRPGPDRGGVTACLPDGQAGYSLLELVTVFLLVGITLAASLPAFSRLMQSNNLQNAAQQFAGHFRLARSMAVASGVPHIVGWDLDNEQYEIVRDENGNAAPDEGEPTSGPYILPKRVDVQNLGDEGFSESQVVFTRDGSASESGTLVLSNDRGHSLNLMLLAPTGQVRIE